MRIIHADHSLFLIREFVVHVGCLVIGEWFLRLGCHLFLNRFVSVECRRRRRWRLQHLLPDQHNQH